MKDLDPRYFTGHPIGTGLSSRLWGEVIDEAYNSMYCPFVHGMAQGTLEKASFQAYVTQDAYYLEHYASAYKAAIRIAESWEVVAAPTLIEELEKLVASVYEELEYLHKGYAETWGVNLSNTNPSPATLAYTNFLDYVSETAEDVAEIFAAMLPCARLYCWLGCVIAKDLPESTDLSNPYHQWFTNYSAPAYVVYPPLMENLFDSIAREERYDVFLRHYRRAMELEAAFFDTQPHAPISRSLSLLAVDFDETCTIEDTCGALLNRSTHKHVEPPSKRMRVDDSPSSDVDESGCAETAGAQSHEFTSVVTNRLAREYSTAFSSLLEELLIPRLSDGRVDEVEGEVTSAAPVVIPSTAAADTLGGIDPNARTFDQEGLRAFVEKLSDFDERMNAKLERSGILEGMSEEEATAAAASAQLRPFCIDTLRLALSLQVPVHVISANWCDKLIRGALGMPNALLSPASNGDSQFASNPENWLKVSSKYGLVGVHCNSLELAPPESGEAAGSCTGRLRKGVQTARDKERVFGELLRQVAASRDVKEGDAKEEEEKEGASSTAPMRKAVSLALGRAGPRVLKPKKGDPPGVSVYVGDSVTDLPALLLADYGIVVGNNRHLRRVARHFGVRILPLIAAPLNPQDSRRAQGTIYYANNGWSEIRAFIFGPRSVSDPKYQSTIEELTRSKMVSAEDLLTRDVRPPIVLTIAGSDSCGGAGIQADLKSIIARGGYGASVITALTAQNTKGVARVEAARPGMIEAQLQAVLSDMDVAAIKTGMLPSVAAVKEVASVLHKVYSRRGPDGRLPVHFVIDPVLVSTSGHALADGEVKEALLQLLTPLATLLVPNIPEASAMLGDGRIIATVEDMVVAARELQALAGCGAVLLKGGHVSLRQVQRQAKVASGCAEALEVVDVLFDGTKLHYIRGPYIESRNVHGTGCSLASAIATELAKGVALLPAVHASRLALQRALESSAGFVFGKGKQQPFHHLHMLPPSTVPRLPEVGDATGPTSDESRAASAGRDSDAVVTIEAEIEKATVLLVEEATSMDADEAALDPTLSTEQSSRADVAYPFGSARSGAGRRYYIEGLMRVYAVTDPHCNKAAGRTLLEAVEGALRGGAIIIQIREKDTSGGDFVRLASQTLALCRRYNVPMIINDRVDVAMSIGADGVHVGQDDIPASTVRALLGPRAIIGVSVSSEKEARRALSDGADYVGAGAVFPTLTKTDAGDNIGLWQLQRIVAAAQPLPVVAIGGISLDNAAATIEAGAAGVAVVSVIFKAADLVDATSALRDVVIKAVAEQRAAGKLRYSGGGEDSTSTMMMTMEEAFEFTCKDDEYE